MIVCRQIALYWIARKYRIGLPGAIASAAAMIELVSMP